MNSLTLGFWIFTFLLWSTFLFLERSNEISFYVIGSLMFIIGHLHKI